MANIEFKYVYEIPQRKVVQITYPVDNTKSNIEALAIATADELKYYYEPFTFEECISNAYEIADIPIINMYFDKYWKDSPWILQKITTRNDKVLLYRRYAPFLDDDLVSWFGDHNIVPEINSHLGTKKDNRNKKC